MKQRLSWVPMTVIGIIWNAVICVLLGALFGSPLKPLALAIEAVCFIVWGFLAVVTLWEGRQSEEERRRDE